MRHTEGFNYDEIIKARELKNLKEWESEIIDRYLLNAYRNKQHTGLMKPADIETMFVLIEGWDSDYKHERIKYALNLDSWFKYIDYAELEEARETARKADRHATIALCAVIITAIASLIISFFLSRWQIKSPVEIKEEQLEKIINTVNDLRK